MRSCIVVMEDDAPPVDQFWAFFFQFLSWICLIVAKSIRINRFIGWKEFVAENSLPIPSNRKHNPILMKVCFWGFFWWIMTFFFWNFCRQSIYHSQLQMSSKNDDFSRVQSTNCRSRSDAPVGPRSGGAGACGTQASSLLT